MTVDMWEMSYLDNVPERHFLFPGSMTPALSGLWPHVKGD